jgi:tetratricopeptide (TPR) repeat protein
MTTEHLHDGGDDDMKESEEVRNKVGQLETIPIEAMPLYMTALPQDTDKNDALSAIQALLHEGTPLEQASNFKHQGNECYVLGSQGWEDAIMFYTRGLEVGCGDDKMDAALYMNRAAAELGLEMWAKALEDAQMALKLDEEAVFVKAHSRIIKAAVPLRKAQDARQSVLALEKLDVVVDKDLLQRLTALEVQIQREEQKKQEIEAALQRIRDVIGEIGVQVVAGSEQSILNHFGPDIPKDALPTVHRDKRTKRRMWPILFLYPSAAQSDVLQAVDEKCSLTELLRTVFHEIPAWDVERKYSSIKNLRVFWHDHSHDRLIEVKQNHTISDILGKLVVRIERGILPFYVCPDGADALALIQRFSPDRLESF